MRVSDFLLNLISSGVARFRVAPDAGGANVGISIEPKGEGAIQASTGGNARGKFANDFQRERTLSTDVASGEYAGLFAGRNNAAPGKRAAVFCGENNDASEEDSSIISGRQAKTRYVGESAQATTGFGNVQGSAQVSRVVMRISDDTAVLNGGPATYLYFKPGNGEIKVPTGHSIAVELTIIAARADPPAGSNISRKVFFTASEAFGIDGVRYQSLSGADLDVTIEWNSTTKTARVRVSGGVFSVAYSVVASGEITICKY